MSRGDEMADMYALGAYAQKAWRFESSPRHQENRESCVLD